MRLPSAGFLSFSRVDNLPLHVSCFLTPADRLRGCFCILATANHAAVNMGVQIYFQDSIFFYFGYKPRSLAWFILMGSCIVTLSVVLYPQIYSFYTASKMIVQNLNRIESPFFLKQLPVAFRTEFELCRICSKVLHYLVHACFSTLIFHLLPFWTRQSSLTLCIALL